ncbi:cupin domain-containing protein [Myceligenerans crystallogenes]|uniref:Cupin domain-containing protein n=1 Tax=Myceligenerans crystallogenes TaxID=316335 RepID=A0ABN2N599_9MICO
MSIELIEQDQLPGGNLEGYLHGSSVSMIFERDAPPGFGPRLHRHPYDETFVLRSGRALFTVGDEQIEAVGGQILVARAEVPHKFEVVGPEPYNAVHIHAGDRFETEWLE